MSSLPAGVSVVICCYNSANKLPPTLQHLAAQAVPHSLPWELILVNNASTDNTPETAANSWQQLGSPVPLRIIQEPNPGTDHARRAGVFAAQYSVILFCDDDNWLSPNYLHTGWQFLETHPKVGLVGGQAEAVADEPLPNWFYNMSPYYAACAPAPHSKSFNWEGLWSAGLFGRTMLLRRVLNNSFPFLNQGRIGKNTGCGEDAEICMRSYMLGWQTYYFDKLRFQHYLPASRLTKAYASQLMKSVEEASSHKAVYQRALQIQQMKPAAKKRFYCRQLIKCSWPGKVLLNKNKLLLNRDLLFFLSGKEKYARRETIEVKKFMDNIQP